MLIVLLQVGFAFDLTKDYTVTIFKTSLINLFSCTYAVDVLSSLEEIL